MSHQAHKQLEAMKIVLPEAPKPVAAYLPAIWANDLIFISGQIPMLNGALGWRGCVPGQVSIDQAKAAARQCALNAIAVLADMVEGDLGRVQQIVRIGVFVACPDDFTDQSVVANGASELFMDVFGEAGRHARAATGASSLPLGAPVEVEVLAWAPRSDGLR